MDNDKEDNRKSGECKHCDTCHYGKLEFNSFYCEYKQEGNIKIRIGDPDCCYWSQRYTSNYKNYNSE